MNVISNQTWPSPTAAPRSTYNRNGLTLIEILIAMVMTFIVLYSMMEAFKYANGEISRGRAVIEMSNQLRTAQEIARNDLSHTTAPLRTHVQTTVPPGFFEIIEGPRRDISGAFDDPATANVNEFELYNYLGDIDDIVTFTVSRPNRPFRGRWVNASGNIQMVESTMAEVVWWTSYSDRNQNGLIEYDESVTLFRRVLLIRPDLPTFDMSNFANVNEFRRLNDISCRFDGTNMVANTLSDLGNRINRFCRESATYVDGEPVTPPVVPDPGIPDVIGTRLNRSDLLATRMAVGMNDRNSFSGEDVLLSGITAFDAKVFSPEAKLATLYSVPPGVPPLVPAPDLALKPGDVGYNGSLNPTDPLGAFVDLGYLIKVPNDPSITGSVDYDNLEDIPNFHHVFTTSDIYQPYGQIALDTDFGWWPQRKSVCYYPNPFGGVDLVYDTWTPAYESDGIDQDDADSADQATDGVDTDGLNGVDDNGERETLPPYADSLRGVKITFGLIERRSRQVRQTSVIHSFVPE